jgi:hypothetical protein
MRRRRRQWRPHLLSSPVSASLIEVRWLRLILFVLKIQQLLGSIWCFIVSMGFLDLGLWGFFIERRSSLGLRFTVLLMHVVFVGAVFILDPTLDWRIHEEPWYDYLSCFLNLF